jgi:hypothetical protein
VPTKPSVFADAQSKIALYQERLMVLQNRAQRNKFFSRPALELSSSNQREFCEVSGRPAVLIYRRCMRPVPTSDDCGEEVCQGLRLIAS